MATLSVAATTIGAIALGTQFAEHDPQVRRTRSATAAIANSRSRSERTCASTTRATLIHAVAAMSRVVVIRPGSVSAASASRRKIAGKHSTASTKRISTAPMTPP